MAADINNIKTVADLIAVIDLYFATPKRPPVTGAEANIIFKKMVELTLKQTKTYLNIAERDADTGDRPDFAFVVDASADSTVESGPALYYDNDGAWVKVSEVGKLELVLKWANIQDKPNLVFTQDIPVKLASGKYIGPFKDGDTIPANGKTANEVIVLLTTEVVHPVYRKPTASMSVSPGAGTYEVSRALDIVLDALFTQLEGGPSTGLSVKRNGSVIATSEPYTDNYVNNGPGTVTYSTTYAYAQGPVLRNNLDQLDPVGQIQASTVDTPSYAFNFIYPYFFGVNQANSGFDVYQGNKVVASSSGSIVINFNSAAPAYLWFAHDATQATKTSWMVDALNKGSIGGSSNLFASPITVTVVAAASTKFGGWSRSFKLYVSNFKTAQTSPMTIS